MTGFIIVAVVVIIVISVIVANKEKKKDDTINPPPNPKDDAIQRILDERDRQEKAEQSGKNIESDDEAYTKQRINNHFSQFYNDARSAFIYSYRPEEKIITYSTRSPNDIYKKLTEHIKAIRKLSLRAGGVGQYKSKLLEMERDANYLYEFLKSIESIRTPFMFDMNNYGMIDQEYWKEISSLSDAYADGIISSWKSWILGWDSSNYDKLQSIDITLVLKCIWFYAIRKPFDANKLNNAWDLFCKLYGKDIPDTYIADIYALNNLGAEDLVRNKVKNLLALNPNSDFLTTIASGLMWMQAYREETNVLTHILKSGQSMSEKAQERLHTLSTSGGKTPTAYKVDTHDSNLFFDVSALTWRNDDYEALFNDLAFRGVEMSYSLAVRDQDHNLSIPAGYSVPTLEEMLVKFKKSFNEEYDDVVSAKIKKCIALSGNNKEEIMCIVVKSKECEQLKILVHFTRIGRSLNIKLYTIFTPVGKNISEQKQQALSLYHELSPSVKVWEKSMKDSVLLAIQQLLNQPYNSDENGTANGEEPVF